MGPAAAARAPSGERAARPAFPRPAEPCGELEGYRSAPQRRRHGEPGVGKLPSHGGWAAGPRVPSPVAACSAAGGRPLAKPRFRSQRLATLGWSCRLRASGRRVSGSLLREGLPVLSPGGGLVSRALLLSVIWKCAASIFCLPRAALDAEIPSPGSA